MKRGLRTAGVAAFWLAVWYGLAALIAKPLLLPYPHEVLRSLADLAGQKVFYSSVILSLLRMLAGIAAGIILGSLLAFLCCKSKVAGRILTPAISVVKATPVASFIILLLLWASRNLVPGIISSLVVIPVVWSNVMAGLTHRDRELEEMTRLFRVSPWRRLRKVTLPSLRPYFTAALRSAIGMGWKAGVAAEVLSLPQKSIGRYLYESKLYLNTPDLFAWTLTVIVLSAVIEKLALHFLREGDKMK